MIKRRYITEKAKVLENIQKATSNKSLSKCEKPKYAFLVEDKANKAEIKSAIEEIYAKKKINVTAVNTVTIHRKKRVVRGRVGYKKSFKKAIVTLQAGQSLD